MEFLNQKKQNGYIALMSVIIISLMLLALVAILSISGYFSRFNVLAAEYKRVSLGLAESCVNVALLEIAKDPNYPGNETVPVGTNECNIRTIAYNPSFGYDSNHQKIAAISTWAQYPSINGAVSNLEISATVQDPNFSPPSQLTLRAFVYGGDKLPSHFAPYRVSGTTVSLDTPTIFPAGSYYVTQTNDPDYDLSFSGDCNSSGYVNIGFNENKTCVIVNTYKSKTANLTVVADVVNPYGGPTKSPSEFTLYIDGIEKQSGQSMDLSTEPGQNPHKVTAGSDPDYTPGDWSLPCEPDGDITLNSGDPPQTCKVVYTRNAPPSPSCADTLMMLDRTGSMSSTDLSNERAAAKGLLNLYNPLSPPPQVGVGRFGDSTNGGVEAEVQTRGQLTNNYGDDDPGNDTDNDLYDAIEEATGSNSSVGTNLADAITVGANELTGPRHDPTKEKVLILITDGEPTEPTGTISDDTGYLIPNQTYPPNDWDVNDVANIKVSDNIYVSEDDGQQQGYSQFGFSVPQGYSITGIEVQAEAHSTDSSGCRLGAELSWNNGLNWTSQRTVNLSGSDNLYTYTLSDWGHNWQINEVSNSNFIIRITDVDPGRSCDNTAITYVDKLQVNIHYQTTIDPIETALDAADAAKISGIEIFTIHFGGDPAGIEGQELTAYLASGTTAVPYGTHQPGSADDQSSAAAENSDGDNFYISPTSADMEQIFTDIGIAVCPAAGGPATPPTPSDPTITVVTEVFNNYGGSKQPTDVTISIPTAVDPDKRSLPGKAWPGDTITVAEGSYTISGSDLDNYTKSGDCIGTISAGNNQTCKITYNQNSPPSPPLPPPLPNITIDVWKEMP